MKTLGFLFLKVRKELSYFNSLKIDIFVNIYTKSVKSLGMVFNNTITKLYLNVFKLYIRSSIHSNIYVSINCKLCLQSLEHTHTRVREQ